MESNNISKYNTVKAINEYSKTIDKKTKDNAQIEQLYILSEVSYRKGQVRICVEPAPNPNGKIHMLCLNPKEVLSIILLKEKRILSSSQLYHGSD